MAGRRFSMILDSTKASVTRRLSMLVTKVDSTLFSETVVVETKVFGVDLKTAVARSNKSHYLLPEVVYRCLIYLEQKGVEEGIFRMSGSATDILKFKEQFNQGMDVDLSAYQNPHTIAGLLKLFLRELPQPLLSSDIDLVDDLSVFTSVKAMIDASPQENKCLLGCLFTLLHKIIGKEEITKMGINNLVIVFSAALFCSGSIMATLIKNAPEFFPEDWLQKTKNPNAAESGGGDGEKYVEITLHDDKKELKTSGDDIFTTGSYNEKKAGKWGGVDFLLTQKSDSDLFPSHRRSQSANSTANIRSRSATTSPDVSPNLGHATLSPTLSPTLNPTMKNNGNLKSSGSLNNSPIIGRWRQKTIFDDETETKKDDLPRNKGNGDIFFN